MKILYVEDNDDNVYMLKNRLSRVGFTVVVATDGAQGIAMANSEQPDLILMDLTLPDIRGEEATQRIKADPATTDTTHALVGEAGIACFQLPVVTTVARRHYPDGDLVGLQICWVTLYRTTYRSPNSVT
jgi:CheY-like chemotaxis protein